MAWSKEGWTGAGLERLREGGVESPIELCTVENPSFEDLFPSMLAQVDEYLGRKKCLNERYHSVFKVCWSRWHMDP